MLFFKGVVKTMSLLSAHFHVEIFLQIELLMLYVNTLYVNAVSVLPAGGEGGSGKEGLVR